MEPSEDAGRFEGGASEMRLIVFHRPGPTWDPARKAIDQTDVMAHFNYLRSAADQGLIQLGGPFLGENQGGMMVASAGSGPDTILDLCRNDPAVQSGLIEFEIRSWMLTINN